MKIGIVTDNTCNISKEKLKELNIGYVPLYINKEDEFIKANRLDLEDYYEFIKNSNYVPKTSQPSVKDFEEVYTYMIQEFDYIISVHLSAVLSGTFNSALMAANIVNSDKIKVIDSKLASWALGFLIEDLEKKIKNDEKNLESIINFCKNYYKRVKVYFSVGDLNYLYKGGRIGKAKSLMGGLLKLKPILSLNDGILTPIKNIRGMKKLNKEIVDMSFEKNKNIEHIMVLHTNNKEIAEDIYLNIKNKNIDLEIRKDYIDIVIGTHLGPDSGGLITVWEES